MSVIVLFLRMGRKRKYIEVDDDDARTAIIARKCTFNSLLNNDLDDYVRTKFTETITEICERITTICNLAALLFLYRVNTATDVKQNGGNSIFFTLSGAIKDCFYAVFDKNKSNLMFMPYYFRQMVEEAIANFVWPSEELLSNVLNSAYEMYETNVINNIFVHRWKRIRFYLNMKAFQWNEYEMNETAPEFQVLLNDADVIALLKFLFYKRPLNPDIDAKRVIYDEFLQNLRNLGGPANDDMTTFVKDNWFESLYLFTRIQREIEQFLNDKADLVIQWNEYMKDRMMPQPSVLRPPSNYKVRNFTVVPIHDFKLKHIPIDTKLLLYITNNFIEKGPKIKQNDFYRERDFYWSHYFDMEKIKKLVKGKFEFRHRIVTNSVSATSLFNKPIREEKELTSEDIMFMYRDFFYEIAIDPGMRTWHASVRRTLCHDDMSRCKEVS